MSLSLTVNNCGYELFQFIKTLNLQGKKLGESYQDYNPHNILLDNKKIFPRAVKVDTKIYCSSDLTRCAFYETILLDVSQVSVKRNSERT